MGETLEHPARPRCRELVRSVIAGVTTGNNHLFAKSIPRILLMVEIVERIDAQQVAERHG